MNRAQFAKVAALIFNLKVDADVKTSSFKDVKADDAANGYALPYIEAVKKAGITEGYGEGTFNPAGTVTKEQLATFLVRGLGMNEDAKKTPGVNDATVSDWAKGYVALALEKKLLANGADGKFGGASNATRDLLVTGAYEAKERFVAQEEQKKKEEEEKKKEEEEKNTPPIYTPPYVPPTVATPSASPAGGAVASGTQVTLTSATVSAAVYYTTDLSDPTTSSTLFTGPITIINNTTIKAIAVKSGYSNSAVMTVSYTVAVPTPTITAVEGAPQGAGTKMVEVSVTPNLTGTVYYVVVPASSSAPSASQVLNGQNGMGGPAIKAQNIGASAGMTFPITITALPSDATDYDIYVVLNAEGQTSAPVQVSVTTPLPAYTPPGLSVTDVVYDATSGDLIVSFSEVVDEATAEAETNYTLNIVFDEINTINPNSATLLDDGQSVALDVGNWFTDLAADDIVNLFVSGVKKFDLIPGAGDEIGYGDGNFQREKSAITIVNE